MREIVLDTETTGFDPKAGDRIVEIGAVEIINHLPTGQTYHQYINPQRSMPKDAFAVHGLGDEFLQDKPVFSRIAQEFLDFISDSKLVIHNAAFDMKFLNAELGWAGLPLIPMNRAIDTLEIARRKFPGSPASLDAICRRFGIDNSSRTLHGALLDSEILAQVYLELLGGRQPDLVLDTKKNTNANNSNSNWTSMPRSSSLPSRITESEYLAHKELINQLGNDALWEKYK